MVVSFRVSYQDRRDGSPRCDSGGRDEDHFSRHAVERYRERAFPAADHELAEIRLGALATSARIASSPPRWHAERAKEEAELYLLIADLVFPSPASVRTPKRAGSRRRAAPVGA